MPKILTIQLPAFDKLRLTIKNPGALPGLQPIAVDYLRHFFHTYFNACDTVKLTAAPMAASTAVLMASSDVILARMMVSVPPATVVRVDVSK